MSPGLLAGLTVERTGLQAFLRPVVVNWGLEGIHLGFVVLAGWSVGWHA
jgi:hypothetical protein